MKDDMAKQLMTRIAQGDKTAFAELYRAYEAPLYRFITSKLRDPFEANDVLHDVFMEVWRAAAKFEGRSAVKTWLFGIAYRKVMDRFRKSARTELTDEPPEEVDEQDGFCDLAQAQEAGHVRFCIETLKAAHRMVIELVFYQEMTCREVAETVDIPEGTVKTRLFHAKKLLMHCISGRMQGQFV